MRLIFVIIYRILSLSILFFLLVCYLRGFKINENKNLIFGGKIVGMIYEGQSEPFPYKNFRIINFDGKKFACGNCWFPKGEGVNFLQCVSLDKVVFIEVFDSIEDFVKAIDLGRKYRESNDGNNKRRDF